MRIDSHAHLGDVLFGKNITFKQNVVRHDEYKFLAMIEENANHMPQELEAIDPNVLKKAILDEEQARNSIATLQNMQNALSKNHVDQIWVLPILPHVGFEEILAASKLDERICPFTCIDFDLGQDAVQKAIQDAENGAVGLKVHPVLQNRHMQDEIILNVLQAWQKTKKPVIFHTYSYEYHHAEESARNSPQYGSNLTFVEVVKTFPSLQMIGAHAGGPFDFGQLLDAKEVKNLYVDISFQAGEVVSQFVDAFGPERVLFGSDWPWGCMETPIQIIKDVCKGDAALERQLFYENAASLIKGGVKS